MMCWGREGSLHLHPPEIPDPNWKTLLDAGKSQLFHPKFLGCWGKRGVPPISLPPRSQFQTQLDPPNSNWSYHIPIRASLLPPPHPSSSLPIFGVLVKMGVPPICTAPRSQPQTQLDLPTPPWTIPPSLAPFQLFPPSFGVFVDLGDALHSHSLCGVPSTKS